MTHSQYHFIPTNVIGGSVAIQIYPVLIIGGESQLVSV